MLKSYLAGRLPQTNTKHMRMMYARHHSPVFANGYFKYPQVKEINCFSLTDSQLTAVLC